MALVLDGRLKSSFEHDTSQREEVRDADIHLSRLTGIAPADVDILCDFTREEGLLLVIRCPKRPARYFHGRADPKPLEVKQKSDRETGLVHTGEGKVYVSDYDLMSVWRYLGAGDYEKIVFTASDARLPKILPSEAQGLLDKVNPRLKSPFQHGAQDDYQSAQHPNIQMRTDGPRLADRFAVFNLGEASYVCDGASLRSLYERLLGAGSWKYDERGFHESARR